MRAWNVLILPVTLVIAICAARLGGSVRAPTTPAAPAISLPVTELTLYANGLGHFRRTGEVEGRAKVELGASAAEMNDLLKSLTVDVAAGGSTVVYDSPEPVERALPTFAVDLSTNPTLGELLQQARGEDVEVTLTSGAGEIAGKILGMEERTDSATTPDSKCDVLNLWTDAGVRSICIVQIRAVRFINARLDADVRKALALLATQREAGRKTVRLTIGGAGRRRVGIGYVAEAPVWKASYRLVPGLDGTTRLQGWALIENTTADDWGDVRMTLAGNRPVSFQMDLYPSLFVPRPIVEPAHFAALRPPTYAGPQSNLGIQGGQGGALGFAGGMNVNNTGGQAFLGGGGGIGGIGGAGQSTGNRYRTATANNLALKSDDVPPTFDKYKKRMLEQHEAKENDPIHAVTAIASDPIGEPARYAIENPVTIPRLKSAMAPFLDAAVTATPVSIYAPDVHATRALQALRVKNTTGRPLVNGPVSIVRGDGYGGDARLMDWPVDEERFLAYAIDAGCECKTERDNNTRESLAFRIVAGELEESFQLRVRTHYSFRHRTGPERTVWVEHPLEPGWKLIAPAKAEERTKDRVRFKLDLAVDQTVPLEVIVKKKAAARTVLANIDDAKLQLIADLPITAAAVKQALNDLLAMRGRIRQTTEDLATGRHSITAATEEQARLRTNLERVPNGSELQKQLLDKLSRQEADIDAARKKITTAAGDEKALKEELRKKSANLTVS